MTTPRPIIATRAGSGLAETDAGESGAAFSVTGVVVQTRPSALARVRRALAAMPGVDVHAASAEGRLAVTVESDGEADAAQTLGRLRDVPGVIAASLVYAHAEPAGPGDRT